MDPTRLDALEGYLASHLPGFRGPLQGKKFSGGQSNPTYLLTAASGQYVLRRKPDGVLLPSAHAVDREHRVISALRDSPVPVPDALLLCGDEQVLGSMFYVMSYEPGRIFWDPSLPEVPQEQRTDYYREAINRLAALHSVDLAATGLGDFGRAENYFERQLQRWIKQYRASETETLPAFEQLIVWLEENLPADDGQVSLIHGDYRFDNLIFQPEQTRIRAILDWELSTLGHPLADIAYFCMCLRLPSAGSYKGLHRVDRAAHGLPSEAEIRELYCQARGIGPIEHWTFYVAFSFFRLAAILQGVYKRALDGNASSTQALQVGKMAQPLAQMALDMIANEQP